MTPENFIAFLERYAQREIDKITDAVGPNPTGAWSYERAKKETYNEVIGFINVFTKEYLNDRSSKIA